MFRLIIDLRNSYFIHFYIFGIVIECVIAHKISIFTTLYPQLKKSYHENNSSMPFSGIFINDHILYGTERYHRSGSEQRYQQ